MAKTEKSNKVRQLAAQMLHAGETVRGVAQELGMSTRTVIDVKRRLETLGAEHVAVTRPGRTPGSGRKLSRTSETELLGVVLADPQDYESADYHLWDRARLGAVAMEMFGIHLSRQLINVYLKRWNFLSETPKTAHRRGFWLNRAEKKTVHMFDKIAKRQYSELHVIELHILKPHSTAEVRRQNPKVKSPPIAQAICSSEKVIIQSTGRNKKYRWCAFPVNSGRDLLVDFISRLSVECERVPAACLQAPREFVTPTFREWLKNNPNAAQILILE